MNPGGAGARTFPSPYAGMKGLVIRHEFMTPHQTPTWSRRFGRPKRLRRIFLLAPRDARKQDWSAKARGGVVHPLQHERRYRPRWVGLTDSKLFQNGFFLIGGPGEERRSGAFGEHLCRIPTGNPVIAFDEVGQELRDLFERLARQATNRDATDRQFADFARLKFEPRIGPADRPFAGRIWKLDRDWPTGDPARSLMGDLPRLPDEIRQHRQTWS